MRLPIYAQQMYTSNNLQQPCEHNYNADQMIETKFQNWIASLC